AGGASVQDRNRVGPHREARRPACRPPSCAETAAAPTDRGAGARRTSPCGRASVRAGTGAGPWAYGTPGGYRSRRSPAAATPSPREQARSWDGLLMARAIIAHLHPVPQTGVGVEGVVDRQPTNGLVGKAFRQHLLAVEMPVRVVGGEQ